MKRWQESIVFKDLFEKYVFLAGPRQSGKTTLSQHLCLPEECQYLNYDLAEDRQIILQGEWNRKARLVIFDEFHKYPTWKNFLKGYYDTEGLPPSILVTGSAKMNVFRKGNDSMVGRYYYHRLLPLSVKELESEMHAYEAVRHILKFGNFPEPCLKASQRASKRWQKQYLERVVREDVVDLSNLRQLTKIQLLIDILRQRVGSNISYASIAKDLEVAPQTVKDWVDLLEQLYIVFRVTPYHKNIARSLLKEPKIYFFDCTLAFDENAHLENLVAVSLLKHLWFLEDTQGVTTSLHYLRTKDGKEIDFLTLIDRKVHHVLEVKNSKEQFNSSFHYFFKYLQPEGSYQICLDNIKERSVAGVQMTTAEKYLKNLAI